MGGRIAAQWRGLSGALKRIPSANDHRSFPGDVDDLHGLCIEPVGNLPGSEISAHIGSADVMVPRSESRHARYWIISSGLISYTQSYRVITWESSLSKLERYSHLGHGHARVLSLRGLR